MTKAIQPVDPATMQGNSATAKSIFAGYRQGVLHSRENRHG